MDRYYRTGIPVRSRGVWDDDDDDDFILHQLSPVVSIWRLPQVQHTAPSTGHLSYRPEAFLSMVHSVVQVCLYIIRHTISFVLSYSVPPMKKPGRGRPIWLGTVFGESPLSSYNNHTLIRTCYLYPYHFKKIQSKRCKNKRYLM